MFSFKLLARPDNDDDSQNLLIDHLKDVADISLRIFKSINHNLESILNQKTWEDLVYITGFSHDLGKATTYFQNYIKADEDKQARLRNHSETHHGLLSAIFTYLLIKTYFSQNKIESNDNLISFLPFLFFLMVKKHHGNLSDPINGELLSDQFNFLDKQIKHIDKTEFDYVLKYISQKIHINFSFADIPDDIEVFIKNEFKHPIKRTSVRNKFCKQYPGSVKNYVIFQFFYSILLNADKGSVIIKNENRNRPRLDSHSVNNYKDVKFKQPDSEIDLIREDIFNDAGESIRKVDLKNKIFSLNVPTGSGKTLTALSTALELRERIEKEKSFTPRIIYSLPFTSIIDQNYSVFKDVFDDPPSDILLKHHHLSDIFYKTGGKQDEEYDLNQAQFLIENWESEIIVTTFVQLFHTLLTNSNRSLKKFNKFANSIILLDEVQTIPIKFWHLVSNIFTALADVLNVYIILITATQPRIFSKDKIFELVPDKKKYFDKLNRVNLEFVEDDLTIEEFCVILFDKITSSGESFLIVLNTIRSSLNVFDFFKNKKVDAIFYYLSTNIIPKERLKLISEIKKTEKRKIIISTQLIEAGVDIDVENVWRDFGPLDSINQVSGRCNRNFAKKKGNVKIFQLKNEDGRYFYKYIYGSSALSILETKATFNDQTLFNENEFLNNIDGYYKEIENKMSNAESESIIENVKSLRFDEIAKFSLIEDDDYFKKDVFVELDEDAQLIWQKYNELQYMPNPIDRKNSFLSFKKQFYDYVISIPIKCLPAGFNENIYHISIDEIDQYYDPVTGFILDSELPDKTETAIF